MAEESGPEATGTGTTGVSEANRATLAEYLKAQAAEGGRSSIPLSDMLRPLLSPGARLRGKQWLTAVIAPRERRRAAIAAKRGSLRLHLGSGGNKIVEWLNVDLVGSGADLCWDIRRPLPFPHGAVSAVFLEHVLEHMTLAETLDTLRHIREVMAPGAVIRIGVPDAGLYAINYAQHEAALSDLRPGRPTRMLALREVFQEHGHVSAWDGETLCLALAEAGFSSPTVTPGGESRWLSPAPDRPERIRESVYVESVHRPIQ